METTRHLLLAPDFFAGARQMRASYDDRFASPRSVSKGRFIWDYWHVPNQYTYLRTFAEYVFPAELYSSFLQCLRSWGRDHLGCDRILSPWLSYYIDGCGQELHADVPHGPWAYVFSLTDWENRSFSGGETMLLKPECLDFWRWFDPAKVVEAVELLQLVPPLFNQLTVFDPRIPHGVRPVHGTWDPIRSRVVLHGWFRDPSPLLSDSLAGKLPVSRVEAPLELVRNKLKEFNTVTGLVTARVDLNEDGTASAVTILSNTLVSAKGREEEPEAVAAVIRDVLGNTNFGPAPENAWVILPLKLAAGNAAREETQ